MNARAPPDRLTVWQLLALWVPYLLGQHTEAVVSLDWTDFNAYDQTTLLASLQTKHGRSTPLAWMTVQKSALKGVRNEVEDAVLLRLRELIAPEGEGRERDGRRGARGGRGVRE